MTCGQDSSLIHMTGVQFFAALRIALHAQAGEGVILKSAFKQGTYYLSSRYNERHSKLIKILSP